MSSRRYREMVCLNHPHRPAFVRCKRCGKPLCNECKLESHDGAFCSETCLEKFNEFTIRAQEIDARERGPRRARFIRRLVTWVIIVLVILAIAHFVFGIDSLGEAVARIRGFLK